MRRERLIPYGLFIGAFASSLAGLNPTFFADDSAETVTAGVLLGVPHPPGYPFHTLLTRLACLLPVSHHPFRGNLVAALLAAGVVVLLYRLLRTMGDAKPPLACAFAFLWMAGATVYPASLSAKGGIYQLTALLLGGVLFAILRRRFLLASFLLGLGYGNHWMSMTAYTPGLLVLGWAVSREEPPEPRDYPLMAGLLLAGVSVYLYLPLRAVLQPDLNWGDPRNLRDFKFSFFRTQYSADEGTGTFKVWVDQWAHYLKVAFLEFPGLLLVSAAGVVGAVRRDRARAGGLLLAWAGLVLAVGLVLNLKPDRYHLIEAYALSSHLLLLIFAAWATVRWIGSGTEEGSGPFGRSGRARIALVLVLALLVPALGWRLLKRRQDRYTFAYDYCLNVWRGIPRDSLFFVRGDGIIFPGWFLQWVERRRPDLIAVGVDGLPMRWVRVVLKRMHPDLTVPFPEEQVPFVGAESIAPMTRYLYFSNRDRDKYFSYNKIEDASLPDVRLVPAGLAYHGQVPLPGAGSPPVDPIRVRFLWDTMRLRNLADRGRSQDDRTRQFLLKDYAVIRNGMGVYFEDLADEVKAAAEKSRRPPPAGVLESLYQGCYANFRWASDWAPDDHEFVFNVGNALFNLGRTEESIEWYERSVGLEPDFANAYFNWAVAEYQMARYQKAGDLFEKILRLDARTQPSNDPKKRVDPNLVKQADGALQFMKYQGWYRPSVIEGGHP
jgi:hypothetical protein